VLTCGHVNGESRRGVLEMGEERKEGMKNRRKGGSAGRQCLLRLNPYICFDWRIIMPGFCPHLALLLTFFDFLTNQTLTKYETSSNSSTRPVPSLPYSPTHT
jgi:hypothetical protein